MLKELKNYFKLFVFISLYLITAGVVANINTNFQNNKKKIVKEEIKDEIILYLFNKNIKNKDLSELIFYESKKRKLNPFLIYSIVKTNSNFDINYIKEDGGLKYYGLFSLSSSYLNNYPEKILLKPKLNIYLGLNEIEKKQAIAKNNEIKLLTLLYNKNDYVDKKTLQIIDNIIKEKKIINDEYNEFFKVNYHILKL